MIPETIGDNMSDCSHNVQDRYNSTMAMLLSFFPFAVYISRTLIPLWIALGVPGAVLSILVWSSKRMRSSSSVYLCALAVLDGTFLLLVQMPYHLHMYYEVNVFRPGTCHALPAINMWLQYLSPLLTLGFTIERYISICHPFKRDKLCTVRRAMCVTGCMTASCLALGLVQVHFYQLGDEGCSEDPLIFNATTLESQLYNGWSKTTEVLFFAAVPLVILLFNTLVLLQAKRVMKKQVGGQQPKGKSSATTVTLLTVSFYQIGAVLPVTVLLFVGFSIYSGNLSVPCHLTEADLRKSLWDRPLANIRTFLVYQAVNKIVESLSVSHYAMKFFIYLLTGSMFRHQLLALCSSCLPCLSAYAPTGSGSGVEFQLPVHRTSEERRRWRRKQLGAGVGAGDLDASWTTLMDPEPAGNGRRDSADTGAPDIAEASGSPRQPGDI